MMNEIARIGSGVVLAAAVMLSAGAANAQEMVMQGMRGIEVSGVGEVSVAPDQATLNFAVETNAPTSQEAARENATVMERVIAALVAQGVPREEIETRNFSVYPVYEQVRENTEPRVREYRVTNQVTLDTQELAQVGALIDAALEAGANRVEGLSFGLRDTQAAEAEALRDAVNRARASAEAMAQALGVPLGQLVHATTASNPVRPMGYGVQMMRAEAASMDMAPPIQPGEQTVQARVTLLFDIGG